MEADYKPVISFDACRIQITWRRAELCHREPVKQRQGAIATESRSCEAQEPCGWDKTWCSSSPTLKASCWASLGKHQGVTHASNSWLTDPHSGITACKPGTGKHHHSLLEMEETAKKETQILTRKFCGSWYLTERKGYVILKWEEKASPQCYNCLKERITAPLSMAWIEKMNALKSFLTRSAYLEYRIIMLAHQDVPWEFNLKQMADKKLNLFLQSLCYTDLSLSFMFLRCPQNSLQNLHSPGTWEGS